jgi:hypothetical protein
VTGKDQSNISMAQHYANNSMNLNHRMSPKSLNHSSLFAKSQMQNKEQDLNSTKRTQASGYTQN